MFYISFESKEFDLKRAKVIARRILDWNEKKCQLNDEQLSKLKRIVQPTLNADQNVEEIYQLCMELRDTLVFKNDKGIEVRFYVDDKNETVYLGDAAGITEAMQLNADK